MKMVNTKHMSDSMWQIEKQLLVSCDPNQYYNSDFYQHEFKQIKHMNLDLFTLSLSYRKSDNIKFQKIWEKGVCDKMIRLELNWFILLPLGFFELKRYHMQMFNRLIYKSTSSVLLYGFIMTLTQFRDLIEMQTEAKRIEMIGIEIKTNDLELSKFRINPKLRYQATSIVLQKINLIGWTQNSITEFLVILLEAFSYNPTIMKNLHKIDFTKNYGASSQIIFQKFEDLDYEWNLQC